MNKRYRITSESGYVKRLPCVDESYGRDKVHERMENILAGVENAIGIPKIQRGTHNKEWYILVRNMSDHKENYIKSNTLIEPANDSCKLKSCKNFDEESRKKIFEVFWGFKDKIAQRLIPARNAIPTTESPNFTGSKKKQK